MTQGVRREGWRWSPAQMIETAGEPAGDLLIVLSRLAVRPPPVLPEGAAWHASRTIKHAAAVPVVVGECLPVQRGAERCVHGVERPDAEAEQRRNDGD